MFIWRGARARPRVRSEGRPDFQSEIRARGPHLDGIGATDGPRTLTIGFLMSIDTGATNVFVQIRALSIDYGAKDPRSGLRDAPQRPPR